MSTTTTMTVNGTRDYLEGEHYIKLDNPVKAAPPVIVFFSLLDKTSRDWAMKYNIVPTIRKHVPMGTTVVRYHTASSYPKELGEELVHAWAVASVLQIDDKVIGPLFEAIQGDTKVIDMQGVKAVFEYVGIPPLRFDREASKLKVNVEAKWMEECRQKMNIKRVPSLIVSGRYLVKTEAFGEDLDADKVADVVKQLLEI